MNCKEVHVENITKVFPAENGENITALQNVSLTFYPGEWTYVIGANGSGKSTLLNIIADELHPEQGKIRNDAEHFLLEQKTSANLVPSMTVYENLVLALFKKGKGLWPFKFYKNREIEKRITEVLACFDMELESRLHSSVLTLSGGQCQAVSAAKAILFEPQLLLADEFTSALDQKVAPIIINVLKDYIKSNDAIGITVTHDLHEIPGNGDRVIVLKCGEVVADIRSTDGIEKMSIKNLMRLIHE